MIELNDEEIIELYNDGLSSKEIARRLNISGNTVLNRLHRNNVKIRNRSESSQKILDKEILEELYIYQNLSITNVAKKLEASYYNVEKSLKFHDIKIRDSNYEKVSLEKRRKNYKSFSIEDIRDFVVKNSNSILLEEKYINSKTIMRFQCECTEPFNASFSAFKHDNKRKCDKCIKKDKSEILRKKGKLNKKYTYNEVKEIFKKEGYTLLSTEYIGIDKHLNYLCPKGHENKITLGKFNIGQRCPDCKGERVAAHFRKPFQEVAQIFKDGGCELLETEYKNKDTPMKYRCSCGNISKISLHNFESGRRCQNCKESSLGERIIKDYLDSISVKHEKEKIYEDLKDKRYLKYDFFIEEKILVEFDGRQHFYFSDNTGFDDYELFLSNQKHDQMKNKYSIDNDIPLIRIPYWRIRFIEPILDDVLKYYRIIDSQDFDKELVHTYLVNDPNWSYDTYINSYPSAH